MRKNLTEIVFILDRSGSMSGLEADTIGGFNSMIEKQKKAEGEALISTVLFDNTSEVIHDRVSVQNIKLMTDEDYTVRGCTALLDAIGGAIHHIGNVHKYARAEDVPEHTMFVITTDGMENASRRYDSDKVKKMIERQKEKYGWEFLFLGANIDAVETARHFGISEDRAVNYHSDSEGTQLNYEVVSEAICAVRCNAPLGVDWKKRMLLIFVYILIPTSSLIHVGGFSNFTANLDSSLVKPYIDGNIVGDIVTYLVFTMAGAEMWQRAFSAKDRKSAKKGMFLGTAVYGVTIILVFFMGIVAHQIVGDDILAQYGTTDAAVPALAIKVLPAGLTGLALAGMLSVMMSTADSYLLVSVQTCVRDIGKTVKPEMHEKTEMKLSRIFSIILPIGALIIALYMQNAYNILMFSWSFYAAAAGIPAFAALYWKKATKSGIIAGMIGGFVVCVGWKLLGQPFGLGAALPGTIACAVALICVSLITCKKQPSVYLESAPQL